MYEKLTLGELNGNPWVRALRVLAMAAISAAVVALIPAVSEVDWPGDSDSLIIAVLTAALGGLDKLIRGAD